MMISPPLYLRRQLEKLLNCTLLARLARLEEDVLPEEEEPVEEELPVLVPVLFRSAVMAARVFLPATPSAVRPLAFWYLTTASLVRSPKLRVLLPV